jgi:hypothetical protein
MYEGEASSEATVLSNELYLPLLEGLKTGSLVK